MLKKRMVTSLWAIPLLVAVIWFDPFFTPVVLLLGALAVTEFYRLVSASKPKPLFVFGVIWTLFFIAMRNTEVRLALEPRVTQGLLLAMLLTTGVIFSLVSLLARRDKTTAFPAWAWTMAGILYVGWLLGHLVALRGVEAGRNWVFFAIFCTFGSDTAAFFIGRALGRHKLAPSISPAKTWEGAAGGLLGATGVSLLFLLSTPLSLSPHLNWWQAVTLGLLVSVFGQLGDLVESLFKRNVGAKDSGKFFPGHGGVLDRTDSIVFAVVVVYYWVVWM